MINVERFKIEASEVKATLKTSPMGDKIETEGQARALAPVPVEERDDYFVMTDRRRAGPDRP